MSGIATRLLLVFRCGAEHVLVNSKTETTVVVTLSAAAINLFYREGLTPDDLARQVAEWALLNHQPNTSVDLTVSEDLSRFCQYYFSTQELVKQAC